MPTVCARSSRASSRFGASAATYVKNRPSAELPGSINEGGELGYSWRTRTAPVRRFRACLVCCRLVGDGEAETAPSRPSCTRKVPDPVTTAPCASAAS